MSEMMLTMLNCDGRP